MAVRMVWPVQTDQPLLPVSAIQTYWNLIELVLKCGTFGR